MSAREKIARSCKLVPRVFSYFNMAARGLLANELKTHLGKSQSAWILRLVKEFSNAKVGKISSQPHTFIVHVAIYSFYY